MKQLSLSICAVFASIVSAVSAGQSVRPLVVTKQATTFDLDTTQAPPPRFLPVVPQPKSWVPAGRDVFTVPPVLRVNGSSDAARALIDDWRLVRGRHAAQEASPGCADIVFSPIAKPDAKDESYRIEITPVRMTVSAKGPLGAYWATRTILQLFNATQYQLPQHFPYLAGNRIGLLAHNTLKVHSGWRQTALIALCDLI
jgi:hypothetical protein